MLFSPVFFFPSFFLQATMPKSRALIPQAAAKTTATAAKVKPSAKHTTPAQRNAIVAWLEIPANFKLITGSAAFNRTIVAGAKLKKSDAYRALADHVNVVTSAGWTSEQGKTRYDAYLRTYKATKKAAEATGFGVTDEESKKGIKTVDEKLEIMCPNYQQLDRLFGGRQNVQCSTTEETEPPKDEEEDSEVGDNQSDDGALENGFENDEEFVEDERGTNDYSSAGNSSGGSLVDDSTFDESVSLSLEDAVNQSKAATATPGSRKRKSSSSSISSSADLSSSSRGKRNDDFSSVFLRAQESRDEKDSYRLKVESEFRKNELMLKEKVENASLLLKREEMEEAAESRKLEREFKERQLLLEEKKWTAGNELEKQKLKMGLIQAAITSGKTPADLRGYLDLF
ncbi:hypothetical protein BDR26DRAFT_874399 [Obelidium mucronatum]|nr:hypothetical protein BDR26DRAFT_874399 [Obelidium mucronatum]